eukprot:TRINITY_DN1089_c0_g1_i1.p1 TRINITY_DN1089_c0_g1~~TRINITY_DN1089_c0_g1_i1.p1  ORF type:complete len:696 (+),score=156.24 TRINITY_DN1089_c0_g1_i1:68-2089(+)
MKQKNSENLNLNPHKTEPIKMGSVSSRAQVLGVSLTSIISIVTFLSYFYRAKTSAYIRGIQKRNNLHHEEKDSGQKKAARVGVDAKFFNDLKKLFNIVVPSYFSKEMGYLVLVAASLVSRTYCDLWMLNNRTSIEQQIVKRNWEGFKVLFIQYLMAMFPVSVVNSVLKFGLNQIAISFRNRLTLYLTAKYLRGFTFYKVSNIDGRIVNADQLLTQDVDKFSTSFANLYSNISKPLLDIIIYIRKLSGAIGMTGPFTMIGYLLTSGYYLMKLRRPVAKLTVIQQENEGDYRYVQSRLINTSEEVAFYRGNKAEKEIVENSFQELVNHTRSNLRFNYLIGVIDSVVTKYMASVVGYTVVSFPFFNPSYEPFLNLTQSELMKEYYTSGRMLLNMAVSFGRLTLAGRALTQLAGYTARVVKLDQVLDDLNSGNYKRTMIVHDDEDLVPNSGTINHQDNIIKFEDVPIVTPNGDILVRRLNLEVKSGMNVVISGPNGCGKSSLFRILGGLWPMWGGVLTKPASDKLFYIPQRPYLCIGTLRDQIIYPHSKRDMIDSGKTDEDLKELLGEVHLEYLVSRDQKGFDSVDDWSDVLSGGEKQRIAMARLFYHCPQFAILDECTSSVALDVEAFMYSHCRELNITLFTVSHRKSLWKYHDHVLRYDGKGGYSFDVIQDHEKE